MSPIYFLKPPPQTHQRSAAEHALADDNMKNVNYQLPSVDESKEIEDWMAGADAVMALEGGTAVKAMFLNDKTLESSRPAAEQANYEDYQKVYKLVAAFT